MDSSPDELDESEFIEEKKPDFTWLFLGILIFFTLLFWGVGIWQSDIFQKKQIRYPFYKVTNREFSLFLWQNPHFMKSHVDVKAGYLPHFNREDLSLYPDQADQNVVAPSDVIFHYHVWHRLIGDSLAPRPILAKEFYQFLHQNKEWLPQFWLQAPKGYVELIEKIKRSELLDLQHLSLEVLPFNVRLAFQGWKNYVLEWQEITKMTIKKEEIAVFLRDHPHFGRSYWRNLFPHYLTSFVTNSFSSEKDPSEYLDERELSSFLKIAFYNFVAINRK